MTALALKALELAERELGVTEKPHGSNRGVEIDGYFHSLGEALGRAWCAAFVSAIVMRAALALVAPMTMIPSVRAALLASRNQRLWLTGPEAGCIFVHINEDGTGHCGFVTRARPDGSIETIEGNSDAAGSRTGGSVVENVRAPGYATVYMAIA